MTNKLYDAKPGALVLSADLIGGLVAPNVLINHITLTKIYGDGRVVFIDPSVGSLEIYEGHLDEKQIAALFALLKEKGFWSFSESYYRPEITDAPTNVVTAALYGEPAKKVSCYAGAISAPPGFMQCYQALTYPQLKPSDAKKYTRQPISDKDLQEGWYYGFEYQKKLNTPRDWVWSEAGKSSKWHRPEPVGVTFDSGYMTQLVDGCRHIRFHYAGDPTAAGSTIQFDRNAMSPNVFGDIGVTTLVYYAPQPVTCTLLQQEADKRLFSISMTDYSGPKLRLVVQGNLAHPSGARLLVLDDHEVIQGVHPLQVAAGS